jgi:hypothetical protein
MPPLFVFEVNGNREQQGSFPEQVGFSGPVRLQN